MNNFPSPQKEGRENCATVEEEFGLVCLPIDELDVMLRAVWRCITEILNTTAKSSGSAFDFDNFGNADVVKAPLLLHAAVASGVRACDALLVTLIGLFNNGVCRTIEKKRVG